VGILQYAYFSGPSPQKNGCGTTRDIQKKIEKNFTENLNNFFEIRRSFLQKISMKTRSVA
jgi:hypothetical protein